MCSIEEAIKLAITVRTQHYFKHISSALPASKEHASNMHEFDFSAKYVETSSATDISQPPLRVPLAVVQRGASYCNHVDQFGRPVVVVKLGRLECSLLAGRRVPEETSNSEGSIDDLILTHEDYLFSMIYTLERCCCTSSPSPSVTFLMAL